jgi:predicted amidophosphoribosyltransferase
MDLTGTTSWSCRRCGAASIGTPPDHGLCDECISGLETLAQAAQPDVGACPLCGGPICGDCGQRMTLYIPIPHEEYAALQQHLKEASGDGG